MFYGCDYGCRSTVPAHSDSVGVTFNQIVHDTSWGVTAEKTLEKVELNGSVQSGDFYLGQYHASVILLNNVKIFTDGTVKGHSLDGLGRQADIGLAATFEAGGLTFDLGVFGRNAGVFASRNARGDLVNSGYAESDLPDGLANIHPAPVGLTFKDGHSINALISTEVRGWKLRILPELLGGGERVHQVIGNYQRNWDISQSLSLNAAVEVGFQNFDGALEYETASVVTVELDL